MKNPTKEQLNELYNEQRKSTTEIARIFDKNQSTISRWLKKYGIETDHTRTKISMPTKDGLLDLYFHQMLSLEEIGRQFQVSGVTVKKWFSQFDISIRNQSETIKLAAKYTSWRLIIQNLSINHEIDKNVILFPEHKIAVHFHKNETCKPITKHQKKSKLAEKSGIFLFHIFEYQWKNEETRSKILNQLKHLLGHSKPVYARKCVVKKISPKESGKFVNQFHLQGNCGATFHYGLFYEDELLSVMTFGKSRFSKECEWELVRFCSKTGFRVVGGASKLFQTFLKEQNPESIVSFSHIHCTKGGLYNALGFVLQRVSEPSYVWVKKNQLLSRYQTQRKKLIGEGSENEIMQENGFSKIYDCGNNVWKFTNPYMK